MSVQGCPPGRVTGVDSLRIGELASRVGVSTDVLRVWERRYDLFNPARTVGGYRLYTALDEGRARRVLALRERGIPLADAVARVLGDSSRPSDTSDTSDPLRADGSPSAGDLVDRLDRAVRAFDAVTVNAALDEAVDLYGLSGGLSAVAIGYLQRLGRQWAAGTVGVAHEHFASHLVRRRVGDLLRLHPADGRPTAVLACPAGERHDIGLLVVGVLLSDSAWCVRFLGADTPLSAIRVAGEELDPSLVVLSANRRSSLTGRAGSVRRLARRWPVAIGGPGADPVVAAELGVTLLPADVARAAEAADAMVAGAYSGRLVAAGGRP